MKNVLTVILELDSRLYNKFKTIPTFKNSLKPSDLPLLKVGKNELRMNHYTFGRLQRLLGPTVIYKKEEK